MSYTSPTLTKKHKKQAAGNHQANTDWQARFADGLASAVSAVVCDAGDTGEQATASSQVETARNWFIGHFPLLGTLAVSFEIIENYEICHRLGIEVAAINTQQQKIYINPLGNGSHHTLQTLSRTSFSLNSDRTACERCSPVLCSQELKQKEWEG